MNRKWVVIGAVAAVLVAAVAILVLPGIFKPEVLVTFPVPLKYPGFQVWPTPRTFDQPGTVFVLNGDRIIHVADVLQPPEKVGNETLVASKATDNWNGSLLAQFLGTTPAKLKVGSDQKITVQVQFSGGERWRIDPQLLQSALTKVKWPTAHGGPISEDEGKPYIVTEAIAIHGIDYDVTIDGTQSGAIETPDLTSATGSVSLQRSNVKGWSVHQSLAEPYYVFFNASKVTPDQDRAAPRSVSKFPGEDYAPDEAKEYHPWQVEPEEHRLIWSHEEYPALNETRKASIHTTSRAPSGIDQARLAAWRCSPLCVSSFIEGQHLAHKGVIGILA